MARVVIADAGPLIALAGIDGLHLLRALFSTLYITESVRDECLAKPGVDAERIEGAVAEGWLIVTGSKKQPSPLSPSLGAGETDSILLALEAPETSLLIMDDRLARRYALLRGLHIAGTVRLLDLAEQRGLIESAEDSIREMQSFGYRISFDLLHKIRPE